MMHFDLDLCHSFWRSFADTNEIDGSEHSFFFASFVVAGCLQ